MTAIRLFDHPLAGTAPQEFHATSILDWLRAHYADRPMEGTVQIFRGVATRENLIVGNGEQIWRQLAANDSEMYTVYKSPGTGVEVGAVFTQIAIAVALTVVSSLLFPPPRQPENVNRSQSSDNNKLADRENKVRFMERVEDIYGTVKSVPSLMMPTYSKYIKHRRVEFGYYCVGRGYHALTEIRDADSLIQDIQGSSAAVYDPFTSPNSGHAPKTQIGDAITDKIVTAARRVEVDGMTLKAWNQVQLPNSVRNYGFRADPGGDYINQDSNVGDWQPNFNSVLNVGDTITVSDSSFTRPARSYDQVVYNSSTGLFSRTGGFGNITNYGLALGDTIDITGFGPTDFLNGTYTVDFVSSTSIGVAESISPSAPDAEGGTASRAAQSFSFNGTYEVSEVADKQIRLTTSTFPDYLNNGGTAPQGRIQINDRSQYTNWVTLSQRNCTQVWANVVAGQGMYKFDGGYSVATVEFHLEVQQLDANLNPIGQIVQVWGAVSGSVTDERAVTVEHVTGWTGPTRVRMRRLSDFDYGFGGTVVDEIKWADLYAVSPVTKAHFGNKTTIHTVTYPTARSTAVRSRQLNCLASRLLPTYDGTSFSGAFDAEGRHVSGTIHPTSQIVDIIAAVALDPKIGNVPIEELDMEQMYQVQYQLNQTHWEMGQFNYTLDSDNMSFEETVIMIANAGFCKAYRQSDQYRLAPDLRQDRSVAIFTHRNKQPRTEKITQTFANDGEYDGVQFIYTDPDDNQTKTIILPRDGNYTRLKKFEIPGIRSFAQAWLRANREYRKLLGQRLKLETGVTLDGRALLPNKRIDVVDNTRFKAFDGDVVGWDGGLTLRLSRSVEFMPNEPHSIVLMKRDGTVTDQIPVEPGQDSEHVILQNLPSGVGLVTEYGSMKGIRTIFSFASDSRRKAMGFLVTDLDMRDKKYVKVTGINYSDSYYTADFEPIPPKESVIG